MKKTLILSLLLTGVSVHQSQAGMIQDQMEKILSSIRSSVTNYATDPKKLRSNFCKKGSAWKADFSVCRSFKGLACDNSLDKNHWLFGLCVLVCGVENSSYTKDFLKSTCSKNVSGSKKGISASEADEYATGLIQTINQYKKGELTDLSYSEKAILEVVCQALQALGEANNEISSKDRYFSNYADAVEKALQGELDE